MKNIIKHSILFFILFIFLFNTFKLKILEFKTNKNSYINVDIQSDDTIEKYSLPLGTTINELIDSDSIVKEKFNFDYDIDSPLYNNQIVRLDVNNQLISINNATKEVLVTLPGIGDVIAERIIVYRNTNYGFKSLDEIKNVKGIGDKVYEKIKDLICL